MSSNLNVERIEIERRDVQSGAPVFSKKAVKVPKPSSCTMGTRAERKHGTFAVN